MFCLVHWHAPLPPPMGPNSFIFADISTEKCLHQRSVPLLTMGWHPPMGNPESTTVLLSKLIKICNFIVESFLINSFAF